MSDRLPIEQIISAWKADWGNEFPKRREDKLMQFNAFFETANSYGYTVKEDFPSSVLSKVLYSTINDNYKNKQNLKIWKQINSDLLEQAFVLFFNIVVVKEGKYVENKKTLDGQPLGYEPAPDLVERPELDRSKLQPVGKKATERLSDEDFLNELERGDNE